MKGYIIGNGFDLSHGMSTKYSDFYKYLKKHDQKNIGGFEYFYDCEQENLWGNFEDNIGCIDHEHFMAFMGSIYEDGSEEIRGDINAKDVDFEHIICNHKELMKSLACWIKSIKMPTQKFVLPENAIYLSFNYTSLLEDMELINNTSKTLKDDLSVEIKKGSKLSIAAACFSIYAFQELKKQLTSIEELRFIFTSPTFVAEKTKKEKREFYIPRLNRERSLYGTEFEIKLRNEMTQKAIAKECADWIKEKVTFKSNISDKTIQGQLVVDDTGYTPINNFTTVELGCEKGNVISTTIVKDQSLAQTLIRDFNEIWNDKKVLQEVTDEVVESITAAY